MQLNGEIPLCLDYKKSHGIEIPVHIQISVNTDTYMLIFFKKALL